MDEEALELVRANHYSLIIDESIQVIERMNVTDKDFALIISQLADVGENGVVRWKDKEYDGRFCDYKELADAGSLRMIDSALLNVMNRYAPSFDEVFMLTYLFDGQYQRAHTWTSSDLTTESSVLSWTKTDTGSQMLQTPLHPWTTVV